MVLDKTLSPDGKWIASIIQNNEETSLRIISVDNSKYTITSPPIKLEDGTLFIESESWSPDSSAILASNIVKRGDFPTIGVAIYNIETQEAYQFSPYSSRYGRGSAIYSWSPTGDKIAIRFDPKSFFIIDKKANILYKHSPVSNDTSFIKEFYWDESGLYCILVDKANPEITHYAIKKIDLEKPENNTVVFEHEGIINIIASKDDYLLLQLKTSRNEQDVYQLYRYGISTKESEYISEFEKPINASKSSENSVFTALTTLSSSFPSHPQNNLWIYNWNESQLKDHKGVNTLLRWSREAQGFSVVIKNPDNGYGLRLIYP